jgi:hypothetical protein
LRRGVLLNSLLCGPPCLVGAIFVELDNFEGAELGARIFQVCEHDVCLAGRLQDRLHAAIAVDAAFSGTDEDGTQPESRFRVGCVLTCGALIHGFGDEGENPLPQGLPKRPDREAGWLAQPDDNRSGRVGARVEKNSAGSDPARIKPQLTPLPEPRTECPVQPRFRAGESIAGVMTDEDGKSCEGKVPVNHAQVYLVTLQPILRRAHPRLITLSPTVPRRRGRGGLDRTNKAK